MSAEDHKKTVLATMQALLKPCGFRKKATTFWREVDGLVHLVSLQSSSGSTSSTAKVTVNIAVTAPLALNSWDSVHSVWSGHWRERLGFLAPGGSDVWWQLHDAASAATAAEEIGTLLGSFALPKLAEFPSLSSLLRVLEAGRGPEDTVERPGSPIALIRRALEHQKNALDPGK